MKQLQKTLTRRIKEDSLRRWDRLISDVDKADLKRLRELQFEATKIRGRIDRFVALSNWRLAQLAVGADTIRKPPHSDWSFRPTLWRDPVQPSGMAGVQTNTRFCEHASLFHDCSQAEISIRQTRNKRQDDLAPFAIQLDVFNFEGSFLSLVLDLPESELTGLQSRYILCVAAELEVEREIDIVVRLNIQSGPNTEQMTRGIRKGEVSSALEFDLKEMTFGEGRIDRIWIDLIFNQPAMNAITLRDVTMTRHPRAEF